MISSSNFLNNLCKGIHGIKYNYRHGDKKCETCGTKVSNVTAFLTTQVSKMI